MDAFDWMLKKTASIPELSPVDEGLLFGRSSSSPSTFKHFHVFISVVFVYHILPSKYIVPIDIFSVEKSTFFYDSFVFQISRMYGVN